MSLYIFLYLLVIFTLLHIGYLAYKKYKRFLHGKYLISSVIFFAIWLSIYLIVFSTNPPKETLLILSRLLYLLSLLGGYCMLGFVYFYSPKKNIKKKQKKVNAGFIISFIFVALITLFSPYIIQEMIFDTTLSYYYEDLGILFNVYAILYILNPLLFIFIAKKKIRTLNGVSKTRLKYISIGYSIFILNWIFFLGILPTFDIWIMQKEQILFFIPLILMIYYSIHRYHFIDPFISLGRAFIFINSLLFSALITNLIYNHYISKIGSIFESFWGIEKGFGVIHIGLGIILFLGMYRFLTSKLLISTTHDSLIEKLENIKSKVPFITNINDLNTFLRNSFNSSIGIGNTRIDLFGKNHDKKSEVYNFFHENIKNKYFLNDIVFIEEHKHKLNKKALKDQIGKSTSLIFPIRKSEGQINGLFSLGHKPFKDSYSTMQIQELEKFVRFLTGHIKYLDMYKSIHELNINLDKKVDEKTIKYNNLISKQKEFISVVSHEMRSPITTAIFQADCLLDDIEANKIKKSHLEKEVTSLYNQLTRSSDLVKKLFSVEKYDINKFSLFKEKIDIYKFLKKETHHFIKNNKHIRFDIDLEKDLGTAHIDQVQFRQVIDNLINNAIKFADKNNPHISFAAAKENKNIIIKIEDNGQGFKDADITSIFDKYFTGKSSGIGIGIGLYLCKKIVEFHDGEIQAKFSKKLGGGKFIIKLPK